ncbi:tumor protein p53-inducible nuclear protein 2 isoform X2 [Halichoerus grypus]
MCRVSPAAAAQSQSPAGERSSCELPSRSPAASRSSPRDAARPVISADARTLRRTSTSEPPAHLTAPSPRRSLETGSPFVALTLTLYLGVPEPNITASQLFGPQKGFYTAVGRPPEAVPSPAMFQRLTSLFFSTPPPPEDPECPLALVSEEDEVDGWLIIDLPEGPGLGPARLQSSPLEDLLIEHPSMSVYVTGSTIVLEPGPPSPHPDAALPDGDLSEGELAPARREPRVLHHAAARGPARAALLEKAGQARRLQRARQRAERHALSAKVVQRQNRARESRSRRPKHQGSFVYQPCQRQFNY